MDIHTFMAVYQAAWQARDDAAFAALFAPDGEYHNTPFAVQRGPEQLRAYWQRVELQEDVALRYEVLADETATHYPAAQGWAFAVVYHLTRIGRHKRVRAPTLVPPGKPAALQR